ncbi:LysR family transcriptional regulator [Agrobacterium rhizogenes]|nr:LysR family transcriptional regulator [Rhizobium rhizogenes]NTJ79501.1 LysR family transcriptional regulator [Rhizobium rhizogenes]
MTDLNLIRAFIAIYETESVSGAAVKLNLTQPSVSHALSRLRDMLDDTLFTRTRDGMKPTFVAERMYGIFRSALSEIETAIASRWNFDPKSSNQVFKLAFSDLGEMTFLPHILPRLSQEAPKVGIEVVELEVEKLDDWFATGKIDAAIFNSTSAKVQSRSEPIFQEHYVCLVSARHPRIRDQVSLEQYLSEGHIVVSSHSGHRQVEDQIRAIGAARQVSLRLPHFTGLHDIVAKTELLATLPSRTAHMFASSGMVKYCTIPLPIPEFEVRLHWRETDGEIEAQAWLREILKSCLQGL